MSRFLLAGLTLLLAAIQPLSAYAYLTPEDLMDEGSLSIRFLAPPPSRRSIRDAIESQQERSALQRQEGLEQAQRESGSLPDDEEPMNGAAPEDPEDQTGEEDLGTDEQIDEELTDLDPREQRLLERLREQDEDEWMNQQYIDYMTNGGGNLHSGAPLSGTGPATIITILAVAAAMGETWRRVRRSSAVTR